MIKYFKKLGLIRIFELGMGLLAISLALILITGADVFELGNHMNLATLSTDEIKENMYVKTEINEILDVYGEDTVKDGSYCVIPYPHTEESDDGILTLMAVYIPSKYQDTIEQIMLHTAADEDGRQPTIRISGGIVSIPESDRKLYNECIENIKKNYNLENVEVLEICLMATEVTPLDFIVTGIGIIVIIWLIYMLVYILSNKSQAHVTKFIAKNQINEQEFQQEMEGAKRFGKILISEKYFAFMMRYTVYVIKREDIDRIYQFERASTEAEGPESIKEDILVIRLNNNYQYRIGMKTDNLSKVLAYVEENMVQVTN